MDQISAFYSTRFESMNVHNTSKTRVMAAITIVFRVQRVNIKTDYKSV